MKWYTSIHYSCVCFQWTKRLNTQDVDVDKPPTDPSEARQFSQVISGLQKTYPKDKMEEISTSFCFICLLHLANEQGLKLESAVKEEDEIVPEEVIEQKVGDIWDINVRSPRHLKL